VRYIAREQHENFQQYFSSENSLWYIALNIQTCSIIVNLCAYWADSILSHVMHNCSSDVRCIHVAMIRFFTVSPFACVKKLLPIFVIFCPSPELVDLYIEPERVWWICHLTLAELVKTKQLLRTFKLIGCMTLSVISFSHSYTPSTN